MSNSVTVDSSHQIMLGHFDNIFFFRYCAGLLDLESIVGQWTFKNQIKTTHVFVKHGCPRRQQNQNMAKISKSYILTPPHGHVMSEKGEKPLDELTVQVWLL